MKQALLERAGNLVRVTPSYKSLLAPFLYYDRREQTGGPGSVSTYVPTYLFREENESLIVPAGLLQRVISTLAKFEISIVYKDLRVKRLGEPVYENIEPTRALQDEALIAIIANDMGIIAAPTGFGKSWLMRQFPRMWPDAKIVITSSFSSVVRGTYDELKATLRPNEVGMIGDGKEELGCRVSCVVDRSLLKCDLPNCDIFIFDEVHKAASPSNAALIATIQNARMYGFSASWKGRSDRADLETEAMFGPVIVDKSYMEVQETGSIVPIQVWVMPCNDCPPTEVKGVGLNRWGLWRNNHRNQKIVESIEWATAQFGPDPQMLIIVETVEHAVELGSRLKDFALVYGSMDANKRERWERDGMLPKNVHPITPDVRDQMRQDFRSGKLRRAIATGVWSTGVDFPSLNVLVRADAQAAPILNTQIPGRVTRASKDKDFGVVIDFNDAFNGTLEGRFSRRMTQYKKKGWKTFNIKPVLSYTQD